MNEKVKKQIYGILINILAFLIYIIIIELIFLNISIKHLFIWNLAMTTVSSMLSSSIFQFLNLKNHYFDSNKKIFIFGSILYEIFTGILWCSVFMLIRDFNAVIASK